jgi:hypothetical protein
MVNGMTEVYQFKEQTVADRANPLQSPTQRQRFSRFAKPFARDPVSDALHDDPKSLRKHSPPSVPRARLWG